MSHSSRASREEQANHIPAWEAFPPHGNSEAADTVGLEALQRLLMRPAEATIERVDAIVAARVDPKEAQQVSEFYFALILEAADLGLRLGRAIARFGVPGDPERTLGAAIAAAGLIGYRPSEVLAIAQ